jgi:hypothetical protein
MPNCVCLCFVCVCLCDACVSCMLAVRQSRYGDVCALSCLFVCVCACLPACVLAETLYMLHTHTHTHIHTRARASTHTQTQADWRDGDGSHSGDRPFLRTPGRQGAKIMNACTHMQHKHIHKRDAATHAHTHDIKQHTHTDIHTHTHHTQVTSGVLMALEHIHSLGM